MANAAGPPCAHDGATEPAFGIGSKRCAEFAESVGVGNSARESELCTVVMCRVGSTIAGASRPRAVGCFSFAAAACTGVVRSCRSVISLVRGDLERVEVFDAGIGAERKAHTSSEGRLGEDLRDTRAHRGDDVDVANVSTPMRYRTSSRAPFSTMKSSAWTSSTSQVSARSSGTGWWEHAPWVASAQCRAGGS
jgi:hypothetical protein